jgi:radical SAM superfamily enzyme YgiQ (UPF0313 family)
MSAGQIVQTFAQIKQAGIKAFAYNMVGIPGETEETIQETIELNRQIHPDKLHVSIFHAYPGTDLYDLCAKNHYLTDMVTESYFAPVSSLALPTISRKKVEYYYRIFRTAVLYPKLLPIAKILSRVPVRKNKTLYDLGFSLAYSVFNMMRKNVPASIRKLLFRWLKL